MPSQVRWVVRQPASEDVVEVADLLRQIADLLAGLSTAVVDTVSVHRAAEELIATITFDRSRMLLDPGWLREDVVRSYDGPEPLGDDKQFMIAIADEFEASSVVDLGCGTGVLARSLATTHRTVHGVDPSPAMILHAQAQPGGERVSWTAGTASSIPVGDFDLVVTTGNVIQQILDHEWPAALRAVHNALRSGGHFVFGTRNPAAREWERWDQMYGTTRAVREGDVVRATWCEPFGDRGGTLEAYDDLYVFRDVDELRHSLKEGGFATDAIFGDWDRSALGPTSPNIIILARRF